MPRSKKNDESQQPDLFEYNPITTYIKQYIPSYLVQKNKYSQAFFKANAMQRNIITFAMAQRAIKLSTKENLSSLESRTVTFFTKDLFTALGIPYGGRQVQSYRKDLEVLTGKHITLKGPQGEEHWAIMSHITFDVEKNATEIVFNGDLIDSLDASFGAAKLSFLEYGKLKSIWQKKLYEIIMSYKGHAGKDGNVANTFFLDITYDFLKKAVGEEYKKFVDKDGTVTEEGCSYDSNQFRSRIMRPTLQAFNDICTEFKVIETKDIKEGRKIIGERWIIEIQKNDDDEIKDIVELAKKYAILKDENIISKIFEQKERFLSIFVCYNNIQRISFPIDESDDKLVQRTKLLLLEVISEFKKEL